MEKYVSKETFYTKCLINNKEYPILVIKNIDYILTGIKKDEIFLKDNNVDITIVVTKDMLNNQFIKV